MREKKFLSIFMSYNACPSWLYLNCCFILSFIWPFLLFLLKVVLLIPVKRIRLIKNCKILGVCYNTFFVQNPNFKVKSTLKLSDISIHYLLMTMLFSWSHEKRYMYKSRYLRTFILYILSPTHARIPYLYGIFEFVFVCKTFFQRRRLPLKLFLSINFSFNVIILKCA